MLRRFLVAAISLVGGAVAALAAIIAFSSPEAPPPLAAGDEIPGIARWNFTELPRPQVVSARDGARLAYRRYPGADDKAVILVHGSTGTSVSMHEVALALQQAGATVYAVDLRGHGGSGTTNGDVSYRGQLDDDLVDLVEALGIDRPGVRRTLAGFSSGGGFVLRTAGGPHASLFTDYLAISPFIAPDSPTNRPDSGGWTSVAVPRIVALSILDRLGLPWFQGLPAVHFATSAKADDKRTPVYSYRLATSLQLGRDWRAALARIAAPTEIVVGSADELFRGDAFAPLMKEINPRIRVEVVPGQGHLAMIADGAGLAAIAAAWKSLAASR